MLAAGELFYNQAILFRQTTFLFRFRTANFTALFIWISFFILTLVFVSQWFILLPEILIVPSQFPLTFLQTERATLLFIAQLFSILVLIGMVYLNWVLLLLFQNFMSGSRLELMCMFLIVNIWSSLCFWYSLWKSLFSCLPSN